MHLFIDLLQAIAAVIGALGAAIGVVRIVPRLIDHGKTVMELNAALERERNASEAAKNYRLTAEAWQARVDAMTESIDELKGDLAAAIVYIVELIVFFKHDGTADQVPPYPERLQHLIEDGIRENSERRGNAA